MAKRDKIFMRRLLWTAIIAFLGLDLYFGLAPTYKFKYYYYSKDSTRVLTRITYPNEFFLTNDTYLVPGYYDKHQFPDRYVNPNLNGDGEWAEYVTFHHKGILVIGFAAETKRLSNDFCYYSNSVTYYADARKLDSLQASLKDTEKIAIYSYDK